MSRRLSAPGVLAFLLFAVVFGAPRAHAVAPQYQCNSAGSRCVALAPTAWRYMAYLGYGANLPQPSYSSMAEIQSAIQSYWLSHSPAWCSMSLTSVQTDYIPGPWLVVTSPTYANGLEYQRQHVVNYEGMRHPYGSAPCNDPYTYSAAILQDRTVGCPSGYTMIYEAGPPVVGPYCAMPWTQVDGSKCPNCKGGVVRGNPVEIGSGNKRQSETDYRAAGASPLGFTRYYNSWIAYAQGNAALPPTKLGPAWTADYLQSIRYAAEGSIKTAVVFRPEGDRVMFNEVGGAFETPGDLDLKLTAQRNASGAITGWKLKTASDATENYDASGTLLSIVGRDGIAQTLAYAAGVLASVTDSFGNSLQFTFANERLVSLKIPGGSTISYAYDDSGNLNGVTDAAGKTRQYHYEVGNAFLTGITDESQQRYSTYQYSGYNVVSTELAGGVNKYSVYYSNDQRYVTDPQNTLRIYNFTPSWNALRLSSSPSTCAGCAEPKALTYDSNANVTSRRDFNGNLSCYAFDLSRNLETVRVEGFAATTPACPANLAGYTPAAGSRERKFVRTWHPIYRLPASITEANRTTTFTHDSAGNVLTRTVADTSVTPRVSRTWTYQYNALGQRLAEDGPRTDVIDVTAYTYYACATGFECGQLKTVTNAAGHVTTFNTYNAHGQPTQITDPNGLVTSIGYDLRQRITDRCLGSALPACTGGERWHMDYWPTGLLRKITNPDGSLIEYTYDAAHRLTQINDGALNKIVYTLDKASNRVAENTFDPSNALRRAHSRVFNALNQLWKDVNAAGTENVSTVFGYDADGNQTSINAPLGRSSTNAFDELGRLNQLVDANSASTLLGYDASDNLISVKDPKALVTSYAYTGFGERKTQVSPDTGTTTSTYDSAGNLKTRTDARAAVSTYTYDALKRVTAAEFRQGSAVDQTITFTYDSGANGKGRLTGASDIDHSMAWTYDTKGRVTRKTQAYINTTAPVSRSIDYTYNASGQLASMVMPSGQTIAYAYNANNQVASVTLAGASAITILNNVTYDPFGPVSGWTWGNGTSARRTYDADGKLIQIASAGQRTFGYDDAFRITSVNDSTDSTKSWTLGYDILDRLTAATKPAVTIGFAFDANGNRLAQTGTSASVYSVAGASNKLTAVTGALTRAYTYDAAGNALTTGVSVHTYNRRGRMRSTRLLSTNTNTIYVYNALGQRMRKTGGTPGTVYFVYDEAGHLAGEYSGKGALLQETVWLGDIPIATLRPKGTGVEVFYVHTDQLNTPRKITDTGNTVRWRWDPTPFGEGAPTEPAGAFKYNLRFPGQYFDVESNLNYNYFRDMDPATGRYVESDPIGLAGGAGTFSYVNSRPFSHVDPYGLQTSGACPIGQRSRPTPGVQNGYECVDDENAKYDTPYCASGMCAVYPLADPPPVPTCEDICQQKHDKCASLASWYTILSRTSSGLLGFAGMRLGGVGGVVGGTMGGAAAGSAFSIVEARTGMSQAGVDAGCEAATKRCKAACICDTPNPKAGGVR